jgi:hypothetical protein
MQIDFLSSAAFTPGTDKTLTLLVHCSVPDGMSATFCTILPSSSYRRVVDGPAKLLYGAFRSSNWVQPDTSCLEATIDHNNSPGWFTICCSDTARY